MKYKNIFILILVVIVLQNCDSSESKSIELTSSSVPIELDSNYWTPNKLILDDSTIDLSNLNQLYYFDDEKVLVWKIQNDSLFFQSDYLDIQCWWIALNDTLLFPISTRKYFNSDQYDGAHYKIPNVIRPDSLFGTGYEQLNGEVTIDQVLISKEGSRNLLELTKSNLRNPIGIK